MAICAFAQDKASGNCVARHRPRQLQSHLVKWFRWWLRFEQVKPSGTAEEDFSFSIRKAQAIARFAIENRWRVVPLEVTAGELGEKKTAGGASAGKPVYRLSVRRYAHCVRRSGIRRARRRLTSGIPENGRRQSGGLYDVGAERDRFYRHVRNGGNDEPHPTEVATMHTGNDCPDLTDYQADRIISWTMR